MKKIEKFDTSLSISSTYAGQLAAGYISATIKSAETLDKNYVTIVPNVKYKHVIQRMEIASLLADGSCDFTPTGSVALTEKILVPKELQVNLELCKSDFISSWEALQLGDSANHNIPKNFTDYLISEVGMKVAEAIESNLWMGESGTTNSFGGYIENFLEDATVIDVASGSTSGITSSNVNSALQMVYDLIPDSLFGKPDLKFFVSQKVVKAYQGYLSANNYLYQGLVGVKPLDFQGVELVYVPGLTGDNIVAAQSSNLYFGTGLLNDTNQVKIIDMADIDGSLNFRLIMRFTAGVQVGVGAEVVLYHYSA